MEGNEFKEQAAKIIRDNLTFSGQVGDYVIHGALDELWKLHTSNYLGFEHCGKGENICSCTKASECGYLSGNAAERTDSEEWLQKKDIRHHPIITDRTRPKV